MHFELSSAHPLFTPLVEMLLYFFLFLFIWDLRLLIGFFITRRRTEKFLIGVSELIGNGEHEALSCMVKEQHQGRGELFVVGRLILDTLTASGKEAFNDGLRMFYMRMNALLVHKKSGARLMLYLAVLAGFLCGLEGLRFWWIHLALGIISFERSFYAMLENVYFPGLAMVVVLGFLGILYAFSRWRHRTLLEKSERLAFFLWEKRMC